MSTPATGHRPGRGTATSYDELGELHDLFMGAAWDRLAPVVTDELGHLGPEHLVVDLAAGTGMGTTVLAAATRAEIWALEPSLVMRAVLLHRVSGSAALSRRVTVVPGSVPADLGRLPAPVDGLLLMHAVGHLEEDERAGCWSWLASVLAPDGQALVTCEDDSEREVGEVTEERLVGRHTYRVTHLAAGEGFRSRYDVLDGSLLTRSVEVAGRWLRVSVADLADEVAPHGLACRRADSGVAVLSPAR